MSNELELETQEQTEETKEITPIDKKILEIKEQLDPVELIDNGYVTATLTVKSNLLIAKFKSLTGEQVRAINHESSKFAAPKYDSDKDGTRKVIQDPPSRQELLDFVMYETLSHTLLEVNGKSIGKTKAERLKKIPSMDATVVTALYKKAHQFFSAVALLFNDDDEDKQVDTLKN